MSSSPASQYSPATSVARQTAAIQRAFMVRTYGWLVTAILAFVGIETMLFQTGLNLTIFDFVAGTSWLLVLGGFMVASWMAQRATIARSRGVQVAGLVGLVAAYAFIFTPLITYATLSQGTGVLGTAAGITVAGFVALSGIAVTTAVDFSFLRSLLMWGGLLALGVIVLGVFSVLQLGAWFSVAMIGLAGAAVLYDTQRIRHLPPGHEVGAAASLFGSIAMIFYYVLALLSRR